MIKRVWRRISNRDRLAYFMVFAFGLSLLMITSAFQVGWKIGEESQVVRVVEFVVALGLMALGVERLRNLKRRRSDAGKV